MGASSAPPYLGVSGSQPPDPQAGQPGHFAWSIWVKQFVNALDVESVKLGGDTMAGPLSLSGDPVSALHAVTKQYVDSLAGVRQLAVGTTTPTDPRTILWMDTR